MVKQYRKKPVVIEAIQFTQSNWKDVCDFVPKPWFKRIVSLDDAGEVLPGLQITNRKGLLLNTLESNKATGSLLATEGDWIIKGVKGEFYPCKPDIFAATYEEEVAANA